MGELPPILLSVNRASVPFLGVWIGAGALALIFLPPLLFKLFSPRLGGNGPLWVYVLLGLGLPLATLAIGYAFAYWNSNDFDGIAIQGDTLTFRHSLTRRSETVPAVQLESWEQEEVEPTTMGDQYRWILVARLTDGRRLRSESAEATVHNLSRQRLIEELSKRGLPAPVW